MKTGMFTPAMMLMPILLWRQMNRIAWDSQTVITLRMAGFMGLVQQDAAEPQRMLQEKADAAGESMTAALRAAARGKPADKIMAAALRPYSRRASANAKRLSSR